MRLRGPEVFRRTEKSGWRLVHRHADPVVEQNRQCKMAAMAGERDTANESKSTVRACQSGAEAPGDVGSGSGRVPGGVC